MTGRQLFRSFLLLALSQLISGFFFSDNHSINKYKNFLHPRRQDYWPRRRSSLTQGLTRRQSGFNVDSFSGGKTTSHSHEHKHTNDHKHAHKNSHEHLQDHKHKAVHTHIHKHEHHHEHNHHHKHAADHEHSQDHKHAHEHKHKHH